MHGATGGDGALRRTFAAVSAASMHGLGFAKKSPGLSIQSFRTRRLTSGASRRGNSGCVTLVPATGLTGMQTREPYRHVQRGAVQMRRAGAPAE
eukprot:359690-Chlamydomonas_euryale.AAC.7